MSIDFECYLTKKPVLKKKYIVGDNWQIAIHGPAAFEEEDIPAFIYEHIDGRSWLLTIHLEGASDDLAYQELQNLLTSLITKEDACILDQQEGSISSRSGKTMIDAALIPEEPKVVILKFYFTLMKDFEKNQKEKFYELLETFAPKALPRRYGICEPMPYSLEKDGRDHFLESWDKMWGLSWRGTAPFQWVFSHIENPSDLGSNPVGYRYSTIKFQISSEILNTKKALSDLFVFQAEASKFLGVFYSEIKRETSNLDTRWRGLPTDSALSVCIGPRYSALWPAFQDGAEDLGNETYLRNYLTSNIEKISPPLELARPDLPKDNPRNSAPPLAEVFPFKIHKKFKGIPDRYKA